MFKHVVIIASMLLAGPAVAQQLGANSNSQSGSISQSSINIQGSEAPPGHASSAIAPGMSSGHPCAWTPATFGISVVGAGISMGGQDIDDACMLGQMGLSQPAMLMIAARNMQACQALLQAGYVAACHDGRSGSSTTQVATRSTRTVDSNRGPAYGTICRWNQSRTQIEYSIASWASREQASADCRARLGLN